MSDQFIELPGQSQVIPKLLNTFRDMLMRKLIDEIPENDPTRAINIKLGRVLESPLKTNISVAVISGDPEDSDFMDKRIDFDDDFKVKSLMAQEIGGGCYWWRRGTIFFNVFYVRQRYPEVQAYEYAYSFYGRLHSALDRFSFTPIIDDYGEQVHPPVYIESVRFTEGGGADQFMWRGKLKWRVLSWKP